MGFLCIILVLVLLLLFKPFVDELPTVYQLIRSFFVPKVDVKKFGPWAIVTGCTQGIGKAMAFELAKRKLNIVLISLLPDELEKVASEIKATTQVKTKIIVADFSKGREVYENIKSELKNLDIGILVNNVGIAYPYPMYFGEIPEDLMWGMININVGAATQMTHLVLPSMCLKKRGAIITISSASKLTPGPFASLYPASKIYLDYFTEGLRQEYKDSGIIFQILCPSYINTKMNAYWDSLCRTDIFIPDPETYAYHAVNSLGVIDNTTGYWPHRLIYLGMLICPTWLMSYSGGILYKNLRSVNLKKRKSATS